MKNRTIILSVLVLVALAALVIVATKESSESNPPVKPALQEIGTEPISEETQEKSSTEEKWSLEKQIVTYGLGRELTEEEYLKLTSNIQQPPVDVVLPSRDCSQSPKDQTCWELLEEDRNGQKYFIYKQPATRRSVEFTKVLGVQTHHLILESEESSHHSIKAFPLYDWTKFEVKLDFNSPYQLEEFLFDDYGLYFYYQNKEDPGDVKYFERTLRSRDVVGEKITVESLRNGVWGQLDLSDTEEVRKNNYWVKVNKPNTVNTFSTVGNLVDDFEWQRQWLQGDALSRYFYEAEPFFVGSSNSSIFVYHKSSCSSGSSVDPVEVSGGRFLIPMWKNIPGPDASVDVGIMVWSVWQKIGDTEDLELRAVSPLSLTGGAGCVNDRSTEGLFVETQDGEIGFVYKGFAYADEGWTSGSIVLLILTEEEILVEDLYMFDYSTEVESKDHSLDYNQSTGMIVITETTKSRESFESNVWGIKEKKSIEVPF